MMFRFSLLALVVVLLVGCSGPIGFQLGSGNLVSTEYDYRDFTGVHASSDFEVSITQGDDWKVVLTVDDNLASIVDVALRGDDLFFGMKGGAAFRNGTFRAEITMPRLEEVDMSGASTARFYGFGAVDEFKGSASGASQLIGEVVATSADLKASGASTIALEGSADTLNLELSGASKATLDDFPVVDAKVDLSGACSAEVTVTGSLEGSASGSSKVRYGGDPQNVRVHTSGASSADER